MKEPEKIPLDPTTPKAKEVKKYPLNKLYPQTMEDDVYIRPDNDSIYTPIELAKINETLDKAANEDNSKDN